MGEVPNYTPEAVSETKIDQVITPDPPVPELGQHRRPVETLGLSVPGSESIPQAAVIFDRQAYDRQWNKDKKTQRLANLAIAHGYVHTGSGRVFYDRGRAAKRRK